MRARHLHPATGLAHAVQRRQPRLNLAKFHPVATDFDLRIDATMVKYIATRVAVHEVARAIDPAQCRMIDEFLRRHLGQMPIAARQPRAAHAQFTARLAAHLFKPVIQHIGPHSRHSLPDANRPPHHHIAAHASDGTFGRAIAIDHPPPARP